MSAKAADIYWNNTAGGNFSNANNWLPTTVPGPADNSFFTNNATFTVTWTADATNISTSFTPTSGILGAGAAVTQSIDSVSWFITNQYILGQDVSTTGKVVHIDGTLVVTNTTLTASMIIGQSGAGNYILTGGTIFVGRLFLTNVSNSKFIFSHGRMDILRGSIVSNNADFEIGAPARTSIFNMTGGTNQFYYDVNTRIFELGSLAGSTGIMTVTGPTTVWTNNAQLFLNSDGNRLTISNGAKVYMTTLVRVGSGDDGNTLIVTDSGSLLQLGSATHIVGSGNAVGNMMIISNGATATGPNLSTLRLGSAAGSMNNSLVVTDPGSMLSQTGNVFIVGDNAPSNRTSVVNGGVLVSGGLVASRVGGGLPGSNNVMLIAGSGSSWSNSMSSTEVGSSAGGNIMIITNGGAFYSGRLNISTNATALNNKVLLAGLNSFVGLSSSLSIGSNTVTFGSGDMLMTNAAFLEVNSITSGFNGSGTLSNRQAVYQFTTATPTITTNTPSSIVLTNATLSYRNINNAPVIVSNETIRIAWQDGNTFMLNNATNEMISTYTFTNLLTIAGATNYVNLTLVNSNSRWQSTNLTVAAGGLLLSSNGNQSARIVSGGMRLSGRGIVTLGGLTLTK